MVPAVLLEIQEFRGQGYFPLVDYNDWRVAVLRYIEELHPDNIDKMQKHSETDEVFVLLKGRCILFFGEGDIQIHTIYAQDMEPLKIYNVKRNSWHTHTLSEDATVLIVENRDTNLDNSPEIILNPEQKVDLISLTKNLWKDTEAK
jgi:hypothetical protein